MPTPNSGESEQDFISRCIPIVIDDGTAEDDDQAAAVCYSMWEDAMKEQEPGGPGMCVCPECGATAEKERGAPCRSAECPECGKIMAAQVEPDESTPLDIARQAIETARAIVNGSKMLHALAEAKVVTADEMANKMLDELESALIEATKTVDGESYPAEEMELPAEESQQLTSIDVLNLIAELDEMRERLAKFIPAQSNDISGDGLAVEVARDATESDLAEVDAEAIEQGRRAPVVVDFQILKPGPGNKRDNRYYPADVVRRDIHVFEGVDVFATDHNDSERSERTKVGKILQCPTRFTEDNAPVASVLLYDPHQAEKTRNRADAGQLATLEGSIFGRGKAQDGEVEGKKYNVIEAITEGLFFELVSKAGAGGKALNLAENYTEGGREMNDQEQAESANVQEVDIEEAEQADEQEQEPILLDSGVVEAALNSVNLPKFARNALAERQYESEDDLKAAIAEAVKEVKELTGSGRVSDLGESEPEPDKNETVEEHEQRRHDEFNAIMREVGLKEV